MPTVEEIRSTITQLSQESLHTLFPMEEVGEITVQAIEQIGQGAWSTGHKVTIESNGVISEFFLKVAKNGIEDQAVLMSQRADFIKSAQPRDGVVMTYGVYGLSGSEITHLGVDYDSQTLIDMQVVLAIQELLDPEEYTQLLSLLGQLGLSTIQSLEHTKEQNIFNPEAMEMVYHRITDKMVFIHQSPLGSALHTRSEELYGHGIHHVIEDGTRLGGLGALMPEFSQGQITEAHVTLLKNKMSLLADQYMQHCKTRLCAVHGDLWSANIFTDKQGDRVEIIDPSSIGFGEAGVDVVFTFADIAFLDANKSGGEVLSSEFAELADTFVTRYAEQTGDQDIRRFMALFYGYKAFVSALFDAGDNQFQRQQLFHSALGAVEAALQDPDFEFSFQDLDTYVQIGSETMRRN